MSSAVSPGRGTGTGWHPATSAWGQGGAADNGRGPRHNPRARAPRPTAARARAWAGGNSSGGLLTWQSLARDRSARVAVGY